MLDFRRFFQDEEDIAETTTSGSMNVSEAPKKLSGKSADVLSNVHLVDFSRHEMAKCDGRFPQVEEILERLDINAQAVGNAARSMD